MGVVFILLIVAVVLYFKSKSDREKKIQVELLEKSPEVENAMSFINFCNELRQREGRIGSVLCLLRENSIEMDGLVFDEDFLYSREFILRQEKMGTNVSMEIDWEKYRVNEVKKIFGEELARKYQEFNPSEQVKEDSHVVLVYSVYCPNVPSQYYQALKMRSAKKYKVDQCQYFYTVRFGRD